MGIGAYRLKVPKVNSNVSSQNIVSSYGPLDSHLRRNSESHPQFIEKSLFVMGSLYSWQNLGTKGEFM